MKCLKGGAIMSTKSTEARLEHMAQELIAVAKSLKCSVHLDVTRCADGKYCGSLFKIYNHAIAYDFEDNKDVDFTGFVDDTRHIDDLSEEGTNG